MSIESVITKNKKIIRKQFSVLRDKQEGKEELSAKIMDQVFALSDFQKAETILIYLDIKSEVRTRPSMDRLLNSGKIIVIPYVVSEGLKLFYLEDLSELEQGAYGILEPAKELRASKLVSAEEIDLALIPGLVFDSKGARLGYGRGYYDRLLLELRDDCTLVGLAFDCQIGKDIPQEEHDIALDMIITDAKIYA